MKISVVTVCYNSEKTIRHTLESFFAQTYSNKEILIIDGGSQDETLEIVRTFPQDKMLIVSERDGGIFDAMNKGLNRFSGDAIGFLNSDDKYHDRGALAAIAQVLLRSDIVFGNLNFVPDHNGSSPERLWRGSEFTPGSFRRGWMPAHPTFYVRSAVAAQVGPFDLAYRIAADYDWMLRALELHHFKAEFLGRVLIDMRSGGNSTSGLRAYVRGNIESLKSRQIWLGAARADLALLLKPLRKVGQLTSRV